MTAEKFAQIADISLVGLFIVIIVGCFLAAFIGYKRGVWSSTFRLFFIGFLIILSIVCLGPISELVGRFPLDIFPYKSLTITNKNNGLYYNVTITNLNETLFESFKGYYLIFNMSSSPSQATAFATAMTDSVVKFTAFTVSMLFILIFGNLIATILWHAGFKHFIPKLLRKRVKGRWPALAQSLVVFVVSTFMFLAPFTSIVNSVNSAYKRHNQGSPDDNSDNYIAYVDRFLNVYDNSLFAQIFFNWTTNGSTFSFDSAFMDNITTVTIDGTKTSIIDTIYDVTSVVSYFSSSLINEDGMVIDSQILLDEEVVKSLFTTLKDSYVITYLLPIGVDFALTINEVQEYVDPSLIDVSEYDWKNELTNIEEIYLQLLKSGIVEDLIASDGPETEEELIRDILSEEKYPRIKEALKMIDNSKLLTRSLEAVISQTSSKYESFAKYFPSAINELDDISWGFELSVIYDTLYEFNRVDDRLLHAIFTYNDEEEDSVDPSPAPRRANEEDVDLIEIILQHLEEFRQILVGDKDSNNDVINVDNNGRTIVYSDGNKIPDRRYNFFDLVLSKYLSAPIGEEIANLVESSDKQLIVDTYNELFNGVWRYNLKDEFNKMFYALEPFVGHYETLKDILDGNFPTELKDFPDELIDCLAISLPRADYSKLLSVVFYEKIEETINNSETTFTDFGLNFPLIQEGVSAAKNSHTLGKEIAPVILRIKDINAISDVINDSSLSADEIIAEFGGELNQALARLLDAMYSSRIINYSNDVSNTDLNFFNLMNYIFSEMNVNKITFFDGDYQTFINATRGKTWTNTVLDDGTLLYDGENGYFCNVIKKLAETGLLGALDDEHFFEDKNNYILLASPTSQGGYDLPGVLDAVEQSIVFKTTMGGFLDEQISEVVDTSINVTFTNVDDWHEEGLVLKDLLLAIGEAPDLNLNSIDLTAVNDIVGLNNIFHALVKSNIFVDKQNNYFRFGDWLYKKVQSSMKEFEINNTVYDLVKDPDEWKSTYGNQDGPDSGYNILYHDFIYKASNTRRDYSSWVNDEEFYSLPYFDTSSYVYGPYAHYYDNPAFAHDYESYLSVDELGAVVKTVQWASKAALSPKLTEIETEVFAGLMHSINEANCLRIVVYNLYETAKEAFIDSNGNSFFDMSSAQTEYLIDCGSNMYNFDIDKPLRAKEIDCLVDAYSLFKNAQALGVYDNDKFYAEKMTESFTRDIKETLLELNNSAVFHTLGPSTGDTTVFQNTLISLLTKIDNVNEIIYSEKSPKDIYYKNILHEYSDADSKSIYLSKQSFPYDSLYYNQETQAKEITNILEVIKSIIGGLRGDTSEHYNSLTDSNGEITLDFAKIDWSVQRNVDGIKETLELMNQSKVLVDAVPNAVKLALDTYNDVIADNLPSGTTSYVDLSHANIYHNYFIKSSGGYITDWNAKLSEADIESLQFLLHQVCLYQNHSEECYIPQDMTNITDFRDQPLRVQRFTDLLTELADSDIFHRGGRALTIDPDSGNIIYANDSEFSVFQEVSIQFLATTDIKRVIYNANNPKDNASGYNYSGLEDKCFDLARTVFYPERSKEATNNQIDLLSEVFATASKLDSLDFTSAENALSVINAQDVIDILKAMNNSELVYDCVPNALYVVFNDSSIGGLEGVDFSHASPFFEYQYIETVKQSSVDYTRRYPEDELDNIQNLITNYKTFFNELAGRGIDNLNAVSDTLDSGSLNAVLESSYKSYVLHKCNDYKDSDTETTVFEDVIRYLLRHSKIDTFIYNDNNHGYSSANEYAIAKIKQVSHYDFDPSLTNNTGYHKVWFTVNEQEGEANSLLDFMKKGRDVLISSSSTNYDVSQVQFDHVSPDVARTLMYAMNRSDIIAEALPAFIKNGFQGDMGIADLAKYNGMEKTNYYLSQYDFGGAPGTSTLTEIDLIYNALYDMQKLDSSNNFDGYMKFNNFKDFISSNHSINNILRFINSSKIINNEEWITNNNLRVYTRGLIMENLFHSIPYDTANNKYLDSLIIGSSVDDKIYVMSEMFKIDGFNTDYESSGIKSIINLNDEMDEIANCLESNVSNLHQYSDTILALIETTYNADGNNHRSYFISQLVGALLNETIIKEEEKIASYNVYNTMTNYYQLRYGPSSINDINKEAYTTSRTVSSFTYTCINMVEKAGIEGALKVERVISTISLSNKPTASSVREAFEKMSTSFIAKIIYAAEEDNYVNTVTPEVRDNYYADVYDNSYNFKPYGVDFASALVALGLAVE